MIPLEDKARIAIVGGGPAGSLSAYFLLQLAHRVGLTLTVDIYEPRDFLDTGPKGCNLCGGVISESLVQKLAAEGIVLPDDVLMDTIDSYTLHTPYGSTQIKTSEMRIATIYRGGGPSGAEHQRPIPWTSFDQFLLEMARCQGARHVQKRVTKLSWNNDKPQLQCGDESPETYDLLMGCVGLNGSGVEMFESMGFSYKRPLSTKAYITELYLGEDQVHHYLGHAMHIFLLPIPGLKFVAITPKGPYATLIILGENITNSLIEKVFQSKEVQNCLPPGWKTPVHPCQCRPRIHTGPPKNPFADRVVLVGDCSASRLYKDGIGAAFRLAKASAFTAITYGVAAEDFKKHFYPVCQSLTWDNRLGHLIFAMDAFLRPVRFIQEAIINTVRYEQKRPGSPHYVSTALWDTFTGSATYMNIIRSTLHPSVVWRFFLEAMKSIFKLGK